RVSRPDLHPPPGPDLRVLDRTFPWRELLRQGTEVLPDHVWLEPRRPGELLGREGCPGAEEGRFHDCPRVHGTASGVPIGFGPRTGIASSSSVGRSTSIDRRFTKISPYG